ncbi:hypothetical protein V8C42DRAFT_322573 [Trichoderma barbatum]
MTPPLGKPIERTETADEYGRRENCFTNYRRHPFTFRSHVTDIQSTKEATEKDGLVAQLGLKMVPLPNPQLMGDVFDEHQHHQESLETILHDSPSKLSLSTSTNSTTELFIPVGEFDLGSCLERDLQECLSQVRAKRYSDPFRQWLPLACTRSERDEGVGFPPQLNRLWGLLRRELDIDEPILSDAAAKLVREQSKSLKASDYRGLFQQKTTIKPYQYSRLDTLSPPLSPVSDDSSPFIPDGDVAVIDLVSEPSSPERAAIEAVQRGLDSDPIISSTFMTSPSAGELPELFHTCHTVIQEVKADAPVVLTSSDAPSEANVFTDICLSLIGENEEKAPDLLEETGHFEDAFMTLLDDRRYYANRLVNQEQFYPADSISRVPVPLLDFDIQPSEWTIEHFTAKTHFMLLRRSMPRCFDVLPIPRDPRSEISLRWAVFPLERRQPMIVDELVVPDETITKYLSQEPTPLLSSLDFVSKKSYLDVLHIQEDEEIESPFLSNDDENEPPLGGIRQEESLNGICSAQENEQNNSGNSGHLDLHRPIRRRLEDEAVRLLPKSCDTSATSVLLHNFMELKGMKRPRLNTERLVVREPTNVLPPIPNNEASITNDREAAEPPSIDEEMPPVPIPDLEIPSRKASFVISIDLARPILRRLENTWTPEKLIDMDYSCHNTMAWLPGTAQSKETVSPLSFEADISLSPSTGIIITNILKVRQRPLPGSQSQAPLRERVQKVSQKYETLIVLVSESQSRGEVMGALASSDTAGYADFISFATALDGNIEVHFIPGATETMTSWVLSFMCQHSSRSEALSRFLSSEETPWEIFLRRAGMNVIAAKVLSKTLFEQAGASGLALFLEMPMLERIARYGPLLGGEKVLRFMARTLDRRWGD